LVGKSECRDGTDTVLLFVSADLAILEGDDALNVKVLFSLSDYANSKPVEGRNLSSLVSTKEKLGLFSLGQALVAFALDLVVVTESDISQSLNPMLTVEDPPVAIAPADYGKAHCLELESGRQCDGMRPAELSLGLGRHSHVAQFDPP
jgi:hypothetical protein